MPVIRLQRAELQRFGINEDRLIKEVSMIGADLKDFDENEIRVEFFPDRPDLYTVEGVVRAMKGCWGIEKGAPIYSSSKDSGVKIYVDNKMREIRPYIVGAVLKNVKVDNLMIKSMMDFQEKLHLTVGRKRKKLAIGLHDFDKVKPPFYYVPKDKNFKFEPLGFDKEMSLSEILKKHTKGIEYAHILEGLKEYPIILDSEGNVLSFPPIINGNLTQITDSTRNIFIDITGTDLNTLKYVLNILVCSFADRGAFIESVEIIYPDGPLFTPELEYQRISVNKKYVEKILGKKLTDEEIKDSLERMRYTVEMGEKIKVTVPPYRMDILHPIDIVEDIAKGYGYHRFDLSLPTKEKIGSSRSEFREKVRYIMLGLGFFEVTTLTISSPRIQYEMMKIPEEKFVEIENPITDDGTILRSWLIPSLMEILRKNRHRELPQKIFEIGNVMREKKEQHLAFLYIDSSASFTHSKSYTEAILRDLGAENFNIETSDHGSFIEGRQARIIIGSDELGIFGEINPEVLENFELGYPVIAMELNLSKIKEKL